MVANLSKIAVPFVESYMTFKTGHEHVQWWDGRKSQHCSHQGSAWDTTNSLQESISTMMFNTRPTVQRTR
eukprot:scaffold1861_cov85-Cylindrotheca_fusiformis.AAC.1